MTKEERISRATELFKSGYNCSQSVVAATLMFRSLVHSGRFDLVLLEKRVSP